MARRKGVSPSIPVGCIGFCYRCGISVKSGTPWTLIPIDGESRLVHKVCEE